MESIIESMLFAYGKPIKVDLIAEILDKPKKEIIEVIDKMISNINEFNGMEIIKLEDSYQMVTKKENYEYVQKLFEHRSKPALSVAALEVVAIIAYNSNITRAEVEKIRGVNSDGIVNKLLEHEIIEEAGRLDFPGKPIIYKVSENFYRLFGYESLKDLPKIDFQNVNEGDKI